MAINYRKFRDAVEALATDLGPRAAAFQADVTDADQVSQMVAAITERFGAPDVLVHNALAEYSFHGDARTPLERQSWAEMTAQLETALGGAMNTVQALHPHFQNKGFGCVITIGTSLFRNPVVPYHDYQPPKALCWPIPEPSRKSLALWA